ncbi:hypothetical protein [Micromonospora sp. C41]|uniref:hypothetical protein n=1 Tax=Micromonospora sp. C41 TaxID=2824878 RepID=UPI001B39994C|nr:hypothetical protein [Micromonospora sp. C41]MBQ1061333.1 hypothetical protein [Micromonospora sp. C41]
MAIQILSGMRLTPARLNALAPITDRLAADVTRTNTTNLIDTLSVPVIAGAQYDVEALLFYEAPTANDAKIGFNWPSGSMVWGMLGLASGSTTAFGDIQPYAFGAPVNDQTFVLGGGGVSNQLTALMRGTLVTSLSGGNLKVRWAQNTAGAGTSAILKAGSTLQLRRIS